jgi:hypothetical protein
MMTRRNLIGITISIILGIVVAFVTGYFPSPLVGRTVDFIRNGAPLTWTTYVIPNRPHTILWTGLTVDVIFWIAVFYLILYFPIIRQKTTVQLPNRPLA